MPTAGAVDGDINFDFGDHRATRSPDAFGRKRLGYY
jgi:hypothetical protein